MSLFLCVRGQSLVELSFLLPFFVVLLLTIFLLGHYFNLQISLDMAVAEALRAEVLGHDGRQVFFAEWQSLTGKSIEEVEFSLNRNAQFTTAKATTELQLPSFFERFNLPNLKISSKLSMIKSITRK